MGEITFGEQISLPSGGWFVLRPPAIVPERLRKPIKRAIAGVSQEGLVAQNTLATLADLKRRQKEWVTDNPGEPMPSHLEIPADLRDYRPGFSADDVDAFDRATDLLAVALVERWSFPEPITLDGFLERVGPDYDAIRNEAAPLMPQLFPNFAPSENPSSPTNPSGGSETSSEGSQVSPSPTSPPSGEPTDSSSSASA